MQGLNLLTVANSRNTHGAHTHAKQHIVLHNLLYRSCLKKWLHLRIYLVSWVTLGHVKLLLPPDGIQTNAIAK